MSWDELLREDTDADAALSIHLPFYCQSVTACSGAAYERYLIEFEYSTPATHTELWVYRYRTGGRDKQVRSTILYRFRQCGIAVWDLFLVNFCKDAT